MVMRLIEESAGSKERREILIDKSEFLIGRGIDCDLRLSGAEISRHHCLFRGRDVEYTLTDLGSANGTFLNGQRVRSQVLVKDGEHLRVGQFQFRIDLDQREGIDWGAQADISPVEATHRLGDLRKELAREDAEQRRQQPPTE